MEKSKHDGKGKLSDPPMFTALSTWKWKAVSLRSFFFPLWLPGPIQRGLDYLVGEGDVGLVLIAKAKGKVDVAIPAICLNQLDSYINFPLCLHHGDLDFVSSYTYNVDNIQIWFLRLSLFFLFFLCLYCQSRNQINFHKCCSLISWKLF